MAKSRVELREEQLQRKLEESRARREDKGKYGHYLKFPPDTERFNPFKEKDGIHIIDMLTYQAGPNDPYNDEGDYTYVLDVFVHTNVGVNEDSYVCPARNYKKPCPICEEQAAIMAEDDYDEEMAKELEPRRKVAYNVYLDMPPECEKGVQIFDTAHWYMERHITSPSFTQDARTKEVQSFTLPTKDGKSIQFEKKGKGLDAFFGHKLISRDYGVEDLEDKVYCLDKLLYLAPYEEIYEAYFGEKFEGGKMPQPRSEKKDEPASHSRSAGRGGRSGGRSRSEKPEPVKEVDDVPSDSCPYGGEFGKDLDTPLPECDSCDVYDNCLTKYEGLGGGEEESEPEFPPEPEPEKPKSRSASASATTRTPRRSRRGK